MKTHSCWGTPPSRIYSFINKLELNSSICIVGCSDGKFVLPFLRKGFNVTAIDMDEASLFGGAKIAPIHRAIIKQIQYSPCNSKPVYKKLPTETIFIDGLIKRVEKEKLSNKLKYHQIDYYRFPPKEQYDVVFTSCSLQYKSNRDIPVMSLIATLQGNVKLGGYLYMDYMMPLEDTHTWKSEHFFRTGQIKQYFSCEKWEIIYVKEMRKPVFEAAHIDRPEDHFHRFGYILAKRVK